MANCTPRTTTFRVPLKNCSGSEIDHNRVTVNLSVEWTPKGGDEPILVVDITSKPPSTPPISQTPHSADVNSFQQQQQPLPVYQQQVYQQLNTNSVHTTTDQNDVTSTTTSVCNTFQSSSSSSEQPRSNSTCSIEQIEAYLRSHSPPFLALQTNFSDQDVIETTQNSIEETRVDMNNATSGPKSMPAMLNSHYDYQKPSPIRPPSIGSTNSLNNTCLTCYCPYPTVRHLPGCPINRINNQELQSNDSSHQLYVQPSPIPGNHMMHNSLHASSPSFSNANTTHAYDSSNITAIISQPSYLPGNSQFHSTTVLPPLNPMNNSFHPAMTFIINSQPNFQTSPPMPTTGSQQINQKQKRKTPVRRKSSAKEEQRLVQNPNSVQQQASSPKLSNTNPPSRLSSPILTQTKTSPFHDSSQPTDNQSSTPVRHDSPPHPTSSIRSPVELDIPVTQTIDQEKLKSDAIEQIIAEVAHGQGNITFHPIKTSKRNRSNSRGKPSGKHVINSPTNSQQTKPNVADIDQNPSVSECVTQSQNEVHVIHTDTDRTMVLEEIYSTELYRTFNSSGLMTPMTTNPNLDETLLEHSCEDPVISSTKLNSIDIYESYFPSTNSTWGENQVSSSVLTPSPLVPSQYSSQTENFSETNLQSQTLTVSLMETISSVRSNSIDNSTNVQSTPRQQQQQQQQTTTKLAKKSNISSRNSMKSNSLKQTFKAQSRHHSNGKQSIVKPTCTRCGHARLIDITSHEFPKQKGLIFECTSCGNNSIRSNVSAEERRQRLAKVAADHLNTVVCQFCHQMFHSHNDYIVHLKDDHHSDKPTKA